MPVLYIYNLKIPLFYNTHDINESSNRNLTSERQFIFEDKPKDCVMSCILNHYSGEKISNIQKLTISLFSEDEDEEKNGNAGNLRNAENAKNAGNFRNSNQIFCEIKGLLVDDEKYAYTIAENFVNKICKNLSLFISRHNPNQQSFQPRIEPNWKKAVWDSNIYQPVARTENGDMLIADRINLHDSLQCKIKTRLPAAEVNIADWIKEKDGADYENYQFLLNEFYTALGEEKPKSKFFHLFSIIEFCEREYASYNGAERLLTDQEIEKLTKILREELKNKHDSDNEQRSDREHDSNHDSNNERTSDNEHSCDNQRGGVNAVNNIVSRVGKTLTDSTNIGRIEKLQNILTAMGVTQYRYVTEMTAIDKKLLKDLTNLRNKSFHGAITKNKEGNGGTSGYSGNSCSLGASCSSCTSGTSGASSTLGHGEVVVAKSIVATEASTDEEYSNAVVILLSICEQILRFVENGKAQSVAQETSR